jgi:3-dehydroquinate synthase
MIKLHMKISHRLQLETQAKNDKYNIIIGNNILSEIQNHFEFQKYSQIFIITDNIVSKLWLDKLVKGLASLPINYIVVETGEINQNIVTLQKIWNKILLCKCDRKSLIVNLGGGVICDMGGFAASTYMRGIDFIQIPTTLLAQVDASVGGKVAVDFAGGKNIIGNFAQPKAVIIDTETLETLPKREYLSGYGEIIKHGIIYDKKYFDKLQFIENNNLNKTNISDIINTSCKIKSEIVQKDEKESGLRKILNFGHTIGHAIESYSLLTTTPLLHGEAIALGIIAESYISYKNDLIDLKTYKIIVQKFHDCGFSIHYPINTDYDEIINYMLSDKKNSHGKINFTLVSKIGSSIWDQKVNIDTIKESLSQIDANK